MIDDSEHLPRQSRMMKLSSSFSDTDLLFMTYLGSQSRKDLLTCTADNDVVNLFAALDTNHRTLYKCKCVTHWLVVRTIRSGVRCVLIFNLLMYVVSPPRS